MTTPYENDPTAPTPNDYDTASTAPATDGAPVPAHETAPTPAPERHDDKVKGSLAGGTWVALIFGTLLLILLLIFIMQNQQHVNLKLFTWAFSFPAGVGFLLAAIAGALIMAIVGGVRMMELRRQVKKAHRGV